MQHFGQFWFGGKPAAWTEFPVSDQCFNTVCDLLHDGFALGGGSSSKACGFTFEDKSFAP